VSGDHGVPDADEPLARPFLNSTAGTYLPPPAAAPEIRPYLLTGGRTDVDDPAIAIETIVVSNRHGAGWRQPAAASPEKAAILAGCQHPQSVAEVAAHQGLPLGVARVLVADLVAEGLLVSSGAADDQLAELTTNVGFIERLIAGVTAL
jgi:hypothetical protein